MCILLATNKLHSSSQLYRAILALLPPSTSFFLLLTAIILFWGAFQKLFCGGLYTFRLYRALRQLGLAALVCARHKALGYATVVLLGWAAPVGFEPLATWLSPLYHPLDCTGQSATLAVSLVVIYYLLHHLAAAVENKQQESSFAVGLPTKEVHVLS